MNKAEPLHAHPATLMALVLFTLISLGLGVVANLVARAEGGLPREVLPRATARWAPSPWP